MRTIQPLSLAALASLALVGCGSTGMGSAVRADVTARMEGAREPIAACYASGLQKNRKLKGQLVLSFKAAPDTGAFSDVTATRDDIGDAAVTQCVIQEVGKLKLATPQKTALAIEYPISFAPTK